VDRIRVAPTYAEREAQGPNDKSAAYNQMIYEWMRVNGRFPTVDEVAEIIKVESYDWASQVRRRALKAFPKTEMADVAEAAKELLLSRIREGELDNASLVRMLPWIAPQEASAVDVKQEITHRFIVVKPGEGEPAEEEASGNNSA